MNISLKNPFAKLTSATSPASGVLDAEDSLKGKQLLRGRTKAKVETLTAELDTAQRELAHATQAHGGVLYEEKDSTAEALAAQQAGNRVAALEAALAVAIQKDDAAQRDLAAATREASVEADDAVLTAFKASVLELEAVLCGELKRAADKVGVTYMAVKDRSGGDTGVTHQLGKFLGVYPTYLLHANSALIPEGRRYVKDIEEEKKPLSAWADSVAEAMSRRHKGR